MAKVYLAGPMRGYPAFNFHLFLDVEKALIANGFEVFSPATNDLKKGFDPWGYTGHEDLTTIGFDLREALGEDVAWICKHADAVAVLPGWQRSSGARAEVALARALGLRVLNAITLQVIP